MINYLGVFFKKNKSIPSALCCNIKPLEVTWNTLFLQAVIDHNIGHLIEVLQPLSNF